MALETATLISGLQPSNPTTADPVRQGDDHIRLIKGALKNTFPNLTAAMTASAAELNKLAGLATTQAELAKLSGLLSTTAELNKLNGVTATSAEIQKLAGMTSSTAELNKLTGVVTTPTEFNRVAGVTSPVQTQLNSKVNAASATFTGQITEGVHTLSGINPTLDPSNGTIQNHTLTGNTTYVDGLSEGQSMTIIIDDGTGFTVTWPTITWVNNKRIAPELATTGVTVVVIWKSGSALYGALAGNGE